MAVCDFNVDKRISKNASPSVSKYERQVFNLYAETCFLMFRKEHSAEHILMRSVQLVKGQVLVRKVELEEGGGSVFFECDDINLDDLLQAELTANKVIAEERPVRIHVFDSLDEARSHFPNLRAYEERVSGKVRVVEIDGFDWSACTGDHVENTRECEFVIVTRASKTGKINRLDFAVGDVAKNLALGFGRRCLALERLLGCPQHALEKAALNMKNELLDLRRRLSAMTEFIARSVSPKLTGKGVKLFNCNFYEADGSAIRRVASDLVKKNIAVVLFTNLSSGFEVVLAASDKTGLNAFSLLKEAMDNFAGKGGGNSSLAVGWFSKDFAHRLEDFFLNRIEAMVG
jgi:alanyl-tRNA synthetase